MLNISNLTPEYNTYGGSELKCAYTINGKKYMVKMPDPVREKNNSLSYMNNQFSEYIGCKIFDMLGLKTQETLLVKLNKNNKEKIAVACKDFLNSDEQILEMKSLAISLSEETKFDATIEDVYEMLSILGSQGKINYEKCISQFWNMFVGDALIGNTDRHLGNWGFILKENSLRLAPIYDCGSSLHPLLSNDLKEMYLSSPVDMKSIAFNIPSVYKMNGKRVFYHEIFKNPPEDLKKAIKRIVPKIDIEKIKEIIFSTEGLNETQKKFYLNSIIIRKEQILDKAYNKIIGQE